MLDKNKQTSYTIIEQRRIKMKTTNWMIELIENHFPDWKVSYWEKYGKRRIYVCPNHPSKTIIVDLDGLKAWANRPGAYTELKKLVEETSLNVEII